MINEARETVLSAIRQALANQTPLAEAPTGYDRSPKASQTGTGPVLERFADMLRKVGGEAHILNGAEAAVSVLKGILGEWRGQAVLLPPDPELERLGLPRLLEEAEVKILRPRTSSLIDSADAALGITTAQAGIADTGTVILQHVKERGRLAALLAPVHVIFLMKTSVHPDKVTFLAEARRLGFDLETTPMTWVTGPSLTADIEKVLVRGAHGPRRVIVLMY